MKNVSIFFAVFNEEDNLEKLITNWNEPLLKKNIV